MKTENSLLFKARSKKKKKKKVKSCKTEKAPKRDHESDPQVTTFLAL